MEEEWRSIASLAGKYEVSNLGRVRNTNTKHIRKPFVNQGGYHIINFWILEPKKCQRAFLVSRLVALAFLGTPDFMNYEVNHRDGDKSNNKVDNLEWVDRRHNMLHRIYVLHEINCPCAHPKKTQCLETGEVFLSRQHAAKSVGVTQAAISYCVDNPKYTVGGYHWITLKS